ncbi:MAG: peptidylprolyl isomerase [Bacteroidia bacterium]
MNYINYKLKVKEAEEEKLDTSQAFITELSGYRKQLAQPYLTDKDVSDNLLKEAYDRLQKDVRASHILIKVNADALPKDTLAAFSKVMKARDRLIKGEDFSKVAMEVSEDPSAKDNGGDLGYFTGMMMVYPFETVAFNTKVGELSMPVRTKYGYHILKVVDSRPAQGEIRTAHIMVKCPSNADDTTLQQSRKKIDEIYAKLKAGEKFDDLAAQHSDDKGSSKNGGALPWFGTGRMVPEFEKAAFALKNDGDYSEPIKTNYGFHIIKRLEKRGVPSFEEKKGELKNQVARDSRSELSKTSMINKIKKENNFVEFTKNKDEFIKVLDSNLVNGDWKAESVASYNKPLFSLQNKNFTQQDFAQYIASHQSKHNNTTAQVIGYSMYDNFVNDKCLEYEEANLDKKYPEFKNLMREYRDGILLFDLTDKKVWSKAVKDSAGLQEFYDKNKNNYKWNERCDAVIYTCASKEVSDKVRKLLKKKDMTDTMITEEINKDSALNLSIKEGKFSKGDNDIIDSIKWVTGTTPDIMKNNQVVFVNVKSILPSSLKSLEESKGLVTADYQAHLEKSWIDQLRNKYTVTVNEQVLSTIGK